MLSKQIAVTFATALALLFVAPVVAQEMSIPPVTTANAGGYAQPLKVDTDRYDFEQRQKARREGRRADTASPGARTGADAGSQPTQQEIDALMARLAPEYRDRVRRDGEQSALVWLRQAAFEAGQEAAARRR